MAKIRECKEAERKEREANEKEAAEHRADPQWSALKQMARAEHETFRQRREFLQEAGVSEGDIPKLAVENEHARRG